MKTKKFLLPTIFLAITLIAYVAASFAFCYTTQPKVTKGEFPFSITYEYKGETNILEGVYKCEYAGSDTILNEHTRHWSGESIIEYDGEYDFPNVVYSDEDMSLAVYENLSAGYFMGDPLYEDWYSHYDLDGPYPKVEYYDYVNGVSLDDENEDEILNEIGFKIIDCTYPEPINNSFTVSGILYSADNVSIFVLILLVFLVLCIIFVRKDKEYQYSTLDIVGIVFNFIVGILAVPFSFLLCISFGLLGSNLALAEQIAYNTPPFILLCIALSLVFRRKGFSKIGFFIQFGGIPMLVLSIVLDSFAY